MNQNQYVSTALFEHRFWLQILGDHSRFFFHGLSPEEVTEIQKARHFIHVFDQLLASARQELPEVDLSKLNQHAYWYASDFRKFKLHLLRRQLIEDITMHLSPTFLNHMTNEVEEYLRILQFLIVGEIPPLLHPIHHHLLWLFDAEFHAGSIKSRLDGIETRLIEKSSAFQNHFQAFFLKATELAGFLRANLHHFPFLTRFNHEVNLEIRLFQAFLKELKELKLNYQLLGSLSALVPDHMFREECYYLYKLAEVTDVNMPECYPIKPRVEV